MSKKTNFKRIAFVAVASLGLSVFATLAPANATITTGTLDANDYVVAPAADGNTANNMCANTTASNVDSAVIPLSSSGLILDSAATDSGATPAISAVSDTAHVDVTGPGAIASVGANWTILSATSAETVSGGLTGNTDADDYITIKPTAVGTIKVTTKVSATGAAIDVITITVVASCTNGTFSAANSYFAITTAALSLSTAAAFATNVDADAALVASGSTGYIRMVLSDVYGAELDSAALIANATGANCVVGISDAASSATSAGKSASAVDADTARDDVVAVAQADGDIPAKCTVTVTFGGTTIGTKTFTFQGIPSKVTVSDVTVGRNSDYGYYRVTVADSAGNLLPSVAISASSTNADNVAAINSGVITNVQSNSGAATSATAGSGYGKTASVTAANVTAATSGAAGLTRYTCGAGGGTAKIVVRAVVSAATATYVSSDPFAVACGGALATWSISMDKASYQPGEIATLTLTGKDSDGRPVSTFTLLSGVETAFGGMTAVTAPTNNDAFSSGAGIKTYQYSVGTSEGSFVGTFKTTGSTDTAAKTVQYKVANSTASVTNADVLKSIVSLIASINKQIQALQKLILRR